MPTGYDEETQPAKPAAKRATSVKDVDAFLELARKRYSYALEEDAKDRAEAQQDTDFVGGDQWEPKALAKRKKAKRPILTWNRLQTFVAAVCNDGRENKPSIRITAMDGGSKQTAEFLQDRIRHIEYESDADTSYDTAREHQVVSGRGFIRVSTEYAPGKSFEQRACIEPIDNQFSVLFDPQAKKYDRRDADWCFVFSTLSRDAYERKYGKNTVASAANYFAGGDNPAPDWIGIGANGEQIQVAEYWLKEYSKRTICLLEDLTVVYEEEMTGKESSPVMDTREEDVVKVCQYIIDGVEIHDETEFPVPYIPIVPVWGKQMVIRGQRRNYSLVRFAKDPQRLVNLYVSNIAEQIAQMPKTPYIGAVGQFLGREEEWKELNEDPRAFVQYVPKDVNGNPLPPPSRVVNEPPIQALTLGLNQATDAIKAAMGIFDAALGAQSNETSGLAIERRKKESDVANFHFPDNEARSRKHVGRILLALIPILDRNKTEVPTRAEDGKTKLVKVNRVYRDDKTGQNVIHNLDQGNYEPAISTGPSYTSQRQQANDAYAQIAAADKNFMTFAGDLYFRTSDMPGADQIADRYEKMLPPQLKPAPPEGEAQAQQQQQLLQQLGAQHQQLTQQVHAMAQVIEQKKVESDAKFNVEALHSWTAIRVAEINKLVKEGIADADREGARLESMFDRAHEAGSAAMDHAHQVIQAQQSQDGATASQDSAQDHAIQMQGSEQAHQADQTQQTAQQQPEAQP
jgi:hypothetical protein